MLGTLEDKKKMNWKAHIAAQIQVYYSNRHETTGLTPHYLMFGRHPRLAINAFQDIDPDTSFHAKNHSDDIQDLRKRLQFAYPVASRKVNRQTKRHRKRYGCPYCSG